MLSRYDSVITIVLMAAVAVVFGFLGGVVAGAEAVAVPMAAITFLLTGAVVFCRIGHRCRRSSRMQAKPGS
jgi:hypothetical protein